MTFFIMDVLCFDSDLVCDHEGTVETYTKLTDDVCVFICLVHSGFEFSRTGFGNGAEVVFQLFSCHTDTGIFDDKLTCVLVTFNGNLQWLIIRCVFVICQ